MAAFLEISIDVNNALGVTKREQNSILADAWGDAGQTWHTQHRPRHFTFSAITKYNYTPRSRSYNRRKRREFGHTLPLVKTGVSRALSSQATIRSNSKRVDVSMPVRAFNYKPPNSQVDMRREFTTITEDEVAVYEQRMQRVIETGLDRIRKPKRSIPS